MIRTESAARILAASGLLLATLAIRVHAQQAPAPPLTQLQFDIVGVRLVVDPPALTVPKNIATQINTSLVTPPGMGAEVREALDAIADGAQVEAELRGPSIPPTRIAVVPGQPLPIPPLALPGDYFLDGVRLVKNGQTVLDATSTDGRPATTIPIRVINEVFVASVTSRPLSLDEIRGKGIVIDEKNFTAVNFQVAFNIDGAPFTIQAPAVLPTPQLLQTTKDRTEIIRQVSALNRSLAATQTTLPPQFDRPGLNFSIAALPFFPVPTPDDDDPGFDTPPVTGLIVIPGNVAFLHQFFSALLLVANVAPDGSRLELHNMTGTIALPKGLDRVAGSFDQPGDDPLRLARIEGIGVQPTVQIAQRGPDGKLGTADDNPVLPPERQGEGEFLIEGLQEGSQLFDIAIRTTLVGLPSGPVELEGQASGAVFVRNPTFAVTLGHPRTVRSGEPYAIYATVTNTSRTAANLVSVNLDPRSIGGAQLLSDPTVSFDSIAPGQSAVAKYSLRAQLTGEVTFTSFTGDAALGGGIRLETGVDERGVTLAANAIVLPASTDFLPASLVAAAQRVLGQAFSVATAPAEALPADVLFVKRQTVINRGIELAEAGERVKFGEPVARVVQDLLLDWLGNTTLDEGFDQILRTTDAGAALLAELGAIIEPDAVGARALDYQQQFAQATVARAGHMSAIASGPTGSAAPILTVTRASGGVLGVDGEGESASSLVSGALLALDDNGSAARFALIARPEADRYAVEIFAPANGVYDLGIVVPVNATGQLRQLRFAAVALDAGGRARVEIDLSVASSVILSIDRNGDGAPETTRAPDVSDIVAGPPQLIAVRQLESSSRDGIANLSDPAAYGLLIAALFDTAVTVTSAELKTNYRIESNEVIGARLQHSGRLVYLYLQKPVGGLTPRSLGVSGVTDQRGNVVASATRPIVTILNDGAHVFGQVRDAGGSGVGGGILKLTVSDRITSFDVAAIRTDLNGGFDFDFVPRIGDQFTLTAQHPVTRDLAAITSRVRGAGEQLLINPTFLGRGTVRGRVVAPDGVTTVPDIPVALIPGSVLGTRGFQTRPNALGEFTFTDAPVGVFTLSAADGRGGFGQATGVIARGGDVVTQNLALVSQPEDGGRLVGRVFLSDGVTPGAGFTVYVGRYDRDTATIAAVDEAQTDASGSFTFSRALPPGAYDVVAIDPASQQLGATSASVIARTTSSVSIVLESVGAVEGVVFNGRGERVAGALVAGGVALVTTDANGFFRIEGVPAGARTIEAGDPVTRRRGSARVVVLPGQTVSASITLESRATIVGRVLNANGSPVPGASVRIPQIDGFTFVIANNQGVFTLPDLTLGDYLIQAPGPSKEALIEFMEANGIDPRTAFTTGDAPEGLTDPTVPPPASDANAVLAAYQKAVQNFFSVNEGLLDGLPIAGLGGFGWNKVQLFQDATTVVADIKFLPQGNVSGKTVDSAARPTGAAVRVSALKVGKTGFPLVGELSRLNTDPATGQFSFDGIARFDLATFQTAGVRAGDFTLEAASPFSPAHPQFRGQLSTATPNLTDVVLAFPAATDTNGTVSGQVFLPDGVTPAPPGTLVRISFGDLTVTTDADGKFRSQLPIPAGAYTITAQALSGLRGQTSALVPAGGNVDIGLRLLGLGTVSITVRRTSGAPVAGALVKLLRASFPEDRAEGSTDANGVVRFVNLTEGPFSATAEETGTGLSGRSSAAIARDSDAALPVTITAAGVVTGTFLSADGGQPIAFAQVVLATAGVQAYATTDPNGRFVLTAIPVGSFTVEGSDALTGRRGRASGQLVFEGQTVDVTILQAPRGAVRGIVVNADGVAPVPASRVTLVSSSFIETRLQATALSDGSFRFEGVPAGSFRLEATDPVSGFSGSTTGAVTFEGEIVDANVALAPFGSVRVTVLDVDGQPAANASVTITGDAPSRQAAVDASGQFTFENLALGTYRLVARSLADANNGGDAVGTIVSANQVVDATVRFRGVGSVTVTVVPANGVGVVPSADVTLNAKASVGDATPGPLATTLTGFTTAAGTVTFQSVPIGDFFVKAEAAALAGIATGRLASPDTDTPVQVQLGASGVVAGRVLLPDGLTPAASAFVTLRFQSQSSLQSGVLQVTTGLTGAFEFSGIPLGTFTLSAIEVVSSGVRSAAGTLTIDGQRHDVGNLILDNAAPRILQISPADRASGVDERGPIVLTFNERLAPASFNVTPGAGNVALREGSIRVPLQSPEFSADGRSVTLRPARDLTSGALHSLTVTGAPDGPKDEAGLGLLDAFVSTFAVRDSIPPVVTSVSPAGGAQQVPPDAVVRVTFSEAVIGATMSVRDAANAPVAGAVTLASGGTVAIFAPIDFLRANTTYTATVSNVADPAGNALGAGTFTVTFATVDTIAPIITALQLAGTPRVGATVAVQPVITGADVQRVEYALGSTAARIATASPFAASLVMPLNAPSTVVTAVAFDESGNRSEPFSLPVAIQPNAPPTVTLTNVGGGATVAQGQSLSFDVRAVDDDQLAQIVFTAVGSAAASVVRPVAAGESQVTSTFTLQVPAAAPSNSTITVQAGATDTAGGQSQPAILVLNVRDAARPTVTVLNPVNNALVVAGQTVDVVVDAADDVALASVALVCNPALAGCETRSISPQAAISRQTFSITVPATVQPPQTVALSVIATDTSGNITPVGRVLQIADTTKPIITVLESASGSTRIVAGDTATIRVTVSDNVGVTALLFSTEGGVTASGASPVTPALSSGIATVGIPIPADVPNGATVTVRVRVRDAVNNLSDEASLVLTIGDAAPPTIAILEPANEARVAPGQSVTVRARATDDVAVRRFTFTANGSVTASDARDVTPPATPADVTFTLSVPTTAPAGPITLAVEAIDISGNPSGPAQRTVIVNDVVAPQVRIANLVEDAVLDPRNPIAVSVEATDTVGVTAIGFAASGAVSASETRLVTPAATSRTETFIVNVTPIPAAGGTIALSATARDEAGNQGTATAVTVRLRDVVAPDVTSTDPSDGATGVDPRTVLVVRFSEPMDRASLNAASIQLRRGATLVPASLVVSGNDDVVTLTPVTQPLALNTTFLLVVSTGAIDRAGNAIAADRTVTFTTASPDVTPPKVVSINPADNALDVALSTPIVVTFTEAIDPSSVTTQSFGVRIGVIAVAGGFRFLSGNTVVQFTPTELLPTETVVTTELSGAIADAFGNALVRADGSPVSTPLIFTFRTALFSITSPAGDDVIENTTLLLEARASAALGVASVVFTVNGQAQPAVTAPPFTSNFNVGSAASTPALTIVASARNGSGTEIARDERTVNVVVGLKVAPSLVGVPLGGADALRFSVSSPLATDLSIALTAGNPALVGFPVNPVVLPAGETSIDAAMSGLATGATAVIGSSARGDAAAIVAVSPVQPGQTLTPLATPAGLAISSPPAGGFVAARGESTRTLRITILNAPAGAETAVSAFTTNAAVATASADPVAAGQQTTDVHITTFADGVATIILRLGDQVLGLTVFVGAPPAGLVPLLIAQPVGASIANPPVAGQIITAAGRQSTVLVQLLSAPAAADTPVTVITSDSTVATATSTEVRAGEQTVTVTITSIADGVATIVLRAGAAVRALTVFVGAPPAGSVPLLVASPIGVSVAALPTLGRTFAPLGVVRTLGVRLFESPVGVDTPVTVTTNDPTVATVNAPAIVRAGELIANLELTTGSGGTATLTIEAAGVRRELTIVVGSDPTPRTTPPVVAAPVGVTVIPNPSIGRAFGQPGVVTATTLGIPLLGAPAGTPIDVTITSSNPAIVTLGAGATTTVTINAGEQVLQLPIATTGTEGASRLTIEFGDQRRELLIIVGNPPASEIPAVTAPIVGIRIGG